MSDSDDRAELGERLFEMVNTSMPPWFTLPEWMREKYASAAERLQAEARAPLEARVAEVEKERDEARAWVRLLTATERVLTCIYCGEAYPPGSPTHGAEVLTAHAEKCEKHPLRAALADRDRWRDAALRRWPPCHWYTGQDSCANDGRATWEDEDADDAEGEGGGSYRYCDNHKDQPAKLLGGAIVEMSFAALIREHVAAGKGATK